MSVNGNGRNPLEGRGAQGDEVLALSFDPEMAEFARDVRELYVRPPAPALAEQHVGAMLAQAERPHAAAGGVVPEREPKPTLVLRSRWSLMRRLAAAALVTLVAGGGLALAGVRPLDPVREALQRVGILSDDEGDSGEPGAAAPEGGDQRSAGHGDNPSNDGETPGAKHAADTAEEGQATAEQARSGETPPETPGESGEHQPQGELPADAGPPDHAPQGQPEAPLGLSDFEPGRISVHRPAAPPAQTDK